MRPLPIAHAVALVALLAGCAMPRPSLVQAWVSSSGMHTDPSADQAACIEEAVANTQPLNLGNSTPVFTIRMDHRRIEHVQRCMAERGWRPASAP